MDATSYRSGPNDQGGRPVKETRRVLLNGSPVTLVGGGERFETAEGLVIDVAKAIHLPPVEPTKVIAIHLNYRSRVEEFGAKLPSAPTYFQKPTSALNGHRGDVVRPAGCKYLNYEGEIAIVIGSTTRSVTPAEAETHILGYTIANDYGLHDFRDTDAGSMLRVKGSDTFCPLGPGLIEGWDFHNKKIRTTVNGEVVQDASTAEMEWDMYYLVADLARTMTLMPGDVILSGTPAGSRPVNPGDEVSVAVEGLGMLTNTVVQGSDPIPDTFGAQPSESEEVLSTALGGDWEFRGIRPPRG